VVRQLCDRDGQEYHMAEIDAHEGYKYGHEANDRSEREAKATETGVR
jgi:hypothetical protein